MLSAIQYITTNFENIAWDINMTGLEFEELIYNMLAYDLRKYFCQDVRLYKTENTRDGGIDIIIESAITINIMGQQYPISGKNSIKIYIECKSSRKKSLELEKFSKNLLLLKDKNIDYFLLISNSTISPHSFYQAQQSCLNEGIMFKFIGQYFLARYLKSNNALNSTYQIPENVPNLSISYQTEKAYINGKPGLYLYLFYKNNCNSMNTCKFKLKSDRNWHLSESEFEVIIDSMESICKKISVEKVNYDGNDDIVLDFIFDGTCKTVLVSGVSLEYNFNLPFHGDMHKELLSEIIEDVINNCKISQLCLIGEAGIGKTRILDEAFSSLMSKGTTCIRIFITREDTIETIYKKIRSNIKMKNYSENDSLKNIMTILSSYEYKRYFLVFEDLHNAPCEFFLELRELKEFKIIKAPIFLVITGRDDQTVYNEAFYSYIDWIKHEDNDSTLICRKVNRFKEQECKNLIRAIINDAPEYVIDKIESFSRGNPFYLIQYIEYLLETKLIYLVNKNTVGVTNAATFAQHLYVPTKIEDLLNMRFDVIKNHANTKAFEFLLIMAYVGYSCPTNFWNLFFDEQEQSAARFLFENHFLRWSEKEILFDHESIYLVLKKMLLSDENKEICFKNYIDFTDLFDMLTILKRGEIYLYKGEKALAEKCFEIPIKELRNISNISSVNLTSAYYDYYESIYMLSKYNMDKELQKKTLLGTVYVAMHNLSSGEAVLAFEKVNNILVQDFKNDTQFRTAIEVLNAHHFMSVGQMSKAKGLILKLLSTERTHPELFDEQSRFNLFDRASSMYLQENYIEPAIQYNELSFIVAKKTNDNKLKTLSKIISAKINFYINTNKSLRLIDEADRYLSKENSVRINCHNKIGRLTVEILLKPYSDLGQYIERSKDLLNEAVEVNYPLAIIRVKYLLSVLYYMRNSNADIELAKKYLNDGIETSIRSGNIKLLPNYYNLKLIIAEKEDQPFDILNKYANTTLEYLRQQDLLFLGALDFCNSNLINITNYIIFAYTHLSETHIYSFMREIWYYGSDIDCDYNCSTHKSCKYSCSNNGEIFMQNYKKTKNGCLFFLNHKYKYRLQDKYTSYFIPLGI